MSIDYAALFKSQKGLTKKEALKLKTGTWVEVKWLDGPNEKALLVERETVGRNGRNLHLTLFYPQRHAPSGQVATFRDYRQIVKVGPIIEIPQF